MGNPGREQSVQSLPPDVRRRIRSRLLSWYDSNKRDLPWRRRAGDPYAQWVAEIMLQQTRVETVRDYYEKFLKRFPTVEVLARANHQTVLKHWEGLGYYRRVLHLHEAAKSLACDGKIVPRTAGELRQLRGVGDYTSAAIASIAFDEPVAAVDGNVARVIARLCAIGDDILSSKGKRVVQVVADQLLSPKRAGDFNQAWMDFGSMVCTPRSPNCTACPLRPCCKAHELGMVEALPVRGANKKKEIPAVSIVVGIFTDGGRVLARRRAMGGLWSGLWEFPNCEAIVGHNDESRMVELAQSLGLAAVHSITTIGRVCHRLTHRAIEFRVYLASARNDNGGRVPTNGSHAKQETRWVSTNKLSELPMSTAQRKVLVAAKRALREH